MSVMGIGRCIETYLKTSSKTYFKEEKWRMIGMREIETC